MKNALLPIAVFSWAFLSTGVASAQPSAPVNSQSGPVKIFYNSINENAQLYKGTEYIMYDQHIKGDPYFNVADLRPASIFYNGTLYENVPALYELTTGNVVIRQYNQGVLMNLVSEKVGYFTLLDHSFIHIIPDSANNTISDGFYDRIYNGGSVVYVKRQKIAFEDPSTFERSFVVKDRYFIHKDNIWYPVSTESDVLRVFKDKKKDISKYLRQNKIKFKKDHEFAMIKMAGYYDQLTH